MRLVEELRKDFFYVYLACSYFNLSVMLSHWRPSWVGEQVRKCGLDWFNGRVSQAGGRLVGGGWCGGCWPLNRVQLWNSRNQHRAGFYLSVAVWYPDHAPLSGRTGCCTVGYALMRLVVWFWNASKVFVWSSCCLKGVLIGERLIFGYSTFWLWPHTQRWDDAVGPCPFPFLDEASLSLVYSICFSVCIKPSFSLTLPLWLRDLDLALVLSTCRGRNLAVTCCWDIIPAAGISFAEAGGAWQHWWGQEAVTPVAQGSPSETFSVSRVFSESMGLGQMDSSL